jgi:hypothetical protein
LIHRLHIWNSASGRELISTNDCFGDVEPERSRLERRPAFEKPEGLLRVGSGCMSRAFERSLCGIKLTFTWPGSLGPQQPISVAVPQRAISVTLSIRRRSRV